MHLKAKAVPGKYKEGQEIAKVGTTGSLSTGPHLHIDISRDGSLDIFDTGNFEDPEAYFKAIVEPEIPPYAIKVNDPAQLRELKEKYLIRSGKDIYTTLQKITGPSGLRGLKESQIVRIGKSIYKKLP